MKLILQTSPHFFVEEDKILATLFDEGLDLLLLRKPDTEPIYSERLLTLLPEKYHDRVIVHDHFYLKDEFNLLGIHLNKANPIPPSNYKGPIARSCYSLKEVFLAFIFLHDPTILYFCNSFRYSHIISISICFTNES